MDPIVAALLGIIVGALLKGGVDLALDEYRAAKRQRGALRLLGQDLLRALATLQFAIENQRWWPPRWPLASAVWESQSALLAARLKPEDWGAIAWAFYRLQEREVQSQAMRDLPAPPGYEGDWPPFDSEHDAQTVEATIRHVEKARVVVECLLDEPFGGATPPT